MNLYLILSLTFLGSCSDTSSPNAPIRSNNPTSASAEVKAPSPSPTMQSSPSAPTPSAPPSTTPATSQPTAPAVFTLSSSAFANNQKFPVQYVAKNNGGNQSPPLQWTAAPSGTGSFVIQMVDLDFNTPPFVHWIITNIPATSTQLPAGITAGNNLTQPAEAKGANQPKAYAGPNPPNLHRYELTIYAIKAGEVPVINVRDSAANKRELETKSLARSVLIGTYE